VTSVEALYAELKPEIASIANPLFELSEKFVAKRGNFLPHGAVLTNGDQVKLAAATPPDGSDLTNSTEVLPILHDGLRSMARESECKAVAVAESVTVTLEGQRPTAAIKVLLEHRRGLCLALYVPFKKKLFGGYAFGSPFTVPASPEVRAWASSDA
jgi:hypothetical protein